MCVSLFMFTALNGAQNHADTFIFAAISAKRTNILGVEPEFNEVHASRMVFPRNIPSRNAELPHLSYDVKTEKKTRCECGEKVAVFSGKEALATVTLNSIQFLLNS
ncbi:hypothetical protein NECAME_01757 [Necator americanus]|uniref:Uncharacterized protein n=1 Tax=Necator americanus TaxID=51031 RepID=W2TMX0_NECAM|nr:hypothetical protein NECAME_01757 [Necator americanus]ETN83450.1 hypothetical protein NECAME_01757 [Necator americanus]